MTGWRRHFRRRGRERGFTLLELLVALAIASAALAVLFRDISDTLISLDTARHYEAALSRARSHLAALEKDGTITPGTTEGDDGGDFHWRIVVEPLQAASVKAAGILAMVQQPTLFLYRIRVAISWPSGKGRREVSIVTSRIDRRTVE